jgi:hypothetical protein
MITHKDTHHWSDRSGTSIQDFVADLQEKGCSVTDIIFYAEETKAFIMVQTELWTPEGGMDD